MSDIELAAFYLDSVFWLIKSCIQRSTIAVVIYIQNSKFSCDVLCNGCITAPVLFFETIQLAYDWFKSWFVRLKKYVKFRHLPALICIFFFFFIDKNEHSSLVFFSFFSDWISYPYPYCNSYVFFSIIECTAK